MLILDSQVGEDEGRRSEWTDAGAAWALISPLPWFPVEPLPRVIQVRMKEREIGRAERLGFKYL